MQKKNMGCEDMNTCPAYKLYIVAKRKNKVIYKRNDWQTPPTPKAEMIYLKRLWNLILMVVCILIAIILSPTIIIEMIFVVAIYYIENGEVYMDKHLPFCMCAPMCLWNKLKFCRI